MNKRWPTEDKDMLIAKTILQHYAGEKELDSVGMLEVVVNPTQKKMNFRLSDWVVVMARHFNSLYGATQGDFVTRKVLSRYMVQNQVIH